jgi:hypothetical protein
MGSAHAFLRRLVAVVVCSAAGCSFLLRSPDTGKSNDGWRRLGIVLVRFSCFFALPPFACFLSEAAFQGRHQIDIFFDSGWGYARNRLGQNPKPYPGLDQCQLAT